MSLDRIIAEEALDASAEDVVQGRIIASIGESKAHDEESDDWKKLVEEALHIDFKANDLEVAAAKLRSGGFQTYVLSPIDERPKYSDGYRNCTGIAAVGVDRVTGRNISFLTHQGPNGDYYPEERLEKDLRELLREFRSRIVPGTEDILIFGGSYFASENADGRTYMDVYRESIKFVSQIIHEETGIDAEVAIGPSASTADPKERARGTAGLLDTKHRRLYIERPEQKETSREVSFKAADVGKTSITWSNDNFA